MQLSLFSVFSAATMLLLVARPALACTPGTYSCEDQHEGNLYGSNILVCNGFGQWQLSAHCAETYGHPGCQLINGGQGAYCVS